MASTLQGTASTLLERDNVTDFYNLEVICDINPSSTADYCEVFAVHTGVSTITGNAHTTSAVHLPQ